MTMDTIDPFSAFSELLELPQPPKRLYIRGSLKNIENKKRLVVVGSRDCGEYGKQVCRYLIEGLKGCPVVIVSGLALGIDCIAHQSALDAGLTTIAFPGSGLSWECLYPSRHRMLAKSILDKGGAIISEYEPNKRTEPWMFPMRNRLMAGIADFVLVIEAKERSGSLITANLAVEYNKSVGIVPGNIFSETSKGTHSLLKLGAIPITEPTDIAIELGLDAYVA